VKAKEEERTEVAGSEGEASSSVDVDLQHIYVVDGRSLSQTPSRSVCDSIVIFQHKNGVNVQWRRMPPKRMSGALSFRVFLGVFGDRFRVDIEKTRPLFFSVTLRVISACVGRRTRRYCLNPPTEVGFLFCGVLLFSASGGMALGLSLDSLLVYC